MTFRPLFKSARIALVAQVPEDRELFAAWSHNSDYLRNLDDDPIRPINPASIEGWVGQPVQQGGESQSFMIVTLPENKRIGFVALFDIKYPNAAAMFAIGIGDPEYRGKGYGPEAIGLLLDYAFDELGLHRVGLRVMSYNTAGIRAYEKVGFRLEGTIRQAVWREGKRWDILNYGFLRDEWLAKRR